MPKRKSPARKSRRPAEVRNTEAAIPGPATGAGTPAAAAVPPSRQSLIQDAVHEHLRQNPRRDVFLPARITICRRNGKRFDAGTAIVRNISLKGALLAKILLKKKALPAERFTIHLQMAGRRYKGIGAVCEPVRFGTDGKDFELAVAFKEMWAEES
jgi:hypothetical protein